MNRPILALAFLLSVTCGVAHAASKKIVDSNGTSRKIVDSKGIFVGSYYPVSLGVDTGGDVALREISTGVWVQIPVTSAGFQSGVGESGGIYWDAAGCTGNPLLPINNSYNPYVFSSGPYSGSYPSYVDGTTLYYPTPSADAGSRPVWSYEHYTDGEDHCNEYDGSEFGAVPASTFDLSTLDLVPPFSLE